jgi:hypothetical protein
LKETDMVEVADIIADLLLATTPTPLRPAKVPLFVPRSISRSCKTPFARPESGNQSRNRPFSHQTRLSAFLLFRRRTTSRASHVALDIKGEHALHFVTYAFSAAVEDLTASKNYPTKLITPMKEIEGVLTVVSETEYRLSLKRNDFGLAATFCATVGGYIGFDDDCRAVFLDNRDHRSYREGC